MSICIVVNSFLSPLKKRKKKKIPFYCFSLIANLIFFFFPIYLQHIVHFIFFFFQSIQTYTHKHIHIYTYTHQYYTLKKVFINKKKKLFFFLFSSKLNISLKSNSLGRYSHYSSSVVDRSWSRPC